METNLALNGDGNNVTVTSGQLALYQNSSASDAFTRGGITGGSSHYIWVKPAGLMVRGYTNYTIGGSVLVDVPVRVEGTLEVNYAEDTWYEKDILKIQGTDATYGHSLNIVNSGVAKMRANTEVWVNQGVFVDGAGSSLVMWTGATWDTRIKGDVLAGSNGGEIRVREDSPGDYGTATINGDLTLTSASKLTMSWGSVSSDVLAVSGTATLAGTLSMEGQGPTANTPKIGVITAASFGSTDFTTLIWGSINLRSAIIAGVYWVWWEGSEGGA
jgi:hypothetical protein